MSTSRELARLEQAVGRLLPGMSRAERTEWGVFVSWSIKTIGRIKHVQTHFEGDEVAAIFLLSRSLEAFDGLLPAFVKRKDATLPVLLAGYSQFCIAVVEHSLRSDEILPSKGVQVAKRCLGLAFALGQQDPYIADIRSEIAKAGGRAKAAAFARYRLNVGTMYRARTSWSSHLHAANVIAAKLKAEVARQPTSRTMPYGKRPLRPPTASTVYTWLRKDFPVK